ncbi:8730_t:CDS:2, partial [Racocetra persica]
NLSAPVIASIAIITLSSDYSYSNFLDNASSHSQYGYGLYGACLTTSSTFLASTLDASSSTTRCISYSDASTSFTGVNTSLYGGVQFLEALHTIGEIVFYAVLQKDLDNAISSAGFALTVLSFICTIAIVFIYWKTNSMPQEEDQKQFYDTTSYNCVVETP